ncbi:MAG TPA: dynamin family protein [Chloroflexota bacterium]|nr:dynamin family protein [Chloroflexota bacterium]
MSGDPGVSSTRVLSDLPEHGGRSVAGLLRLSAEALVLEPGPGEGTSAVIPLETITRSSVETTFGMLPVLEVWRRQAGREVCSRFEFGHEDDEQPGGEDSSLKDRIAPGIAREAAGHLEGGLRALTGGINRGMRTARQAMDGLGRLEEYRAWPAAIAQAQAAKRARHASRASEARAGDAVEPRMLVPANAAAPSGDPRVRYLWFREQLLQWLLACGRRARELGVRSAPVIQADYPLDSPICRIVVVGEFSRGKSTMINALFGIHGEIALPTGMTPTTPLACAIRVPRVGETDGATITYRSNRAVRDLTLEEFRAGVRLAERGESAGEPSAPDLHLEDARRVEVRVTGAYLPAGVEIEDTPGLNEQAGRSAGAMAALGRADIVLFVLAADQLLGDLEREVIQSTLAAGYHRNVLFLINFWDAIDDEGQRSVLLRRARTMLASFPTPFAGPAAVEGLPHVLTISALSAARAQRQRQPAPEDSGIPALRARLRELLGPGSQALLLRARAGRALRYCALLRAAVSRAAAAAQAEVEGRGAQEGNRQQAEAMAVALRVVEGLPGAIEGAITRPLANLSEGRGSDTRLLMGHDDQRAQMAALRVAMGEVTRAAAQALDLVLAQTRAAYLARGLPQPAAFSVTVDEPIAAPLMDTTDESPSGHRERAAERARAELLRRAEAARIALIREIRVHGPTPIAATKSGDGGAAALARVATLKLLEDDILRLEGILGGFLD